MSGQKGPEALEKLSSGIEGFDDLTAGGLPRRSATLLMGGPGCGKTVLALQVLVNGARNLGEPGIFVAFEENTSRVLSNAESFGWNLGELQKEYLYFLNAHLSPDVVKAGAFDLTGLLLGVEAKARETGAKLMVFDAIDVLLNLLDDPVAECRELYRLHEWLTRNEFTGILTTKVEDNKPATAQRYGFMPFMADCAVLLSQRVTDRVAVRAIRVLKYRGSSHVLNEVPFVIGPAGVEVGSSNGVHPEPQPFKNRVSTGVERLDDMLCGGFYRGTNALITGSSGTGKSMLAGAFIEAACRRDERALFISFDENSCDIVRDLASMSTNLAAHLASGLLRMEAARTEAASSEEHFMRIKRVIAEHQPRCVAIDPLSALARVGGGLAARAVAERLIYLCRNAGITVLFTSLLEGSDPHLETTTLHVSTISDSWIQISYSLHGGERNRALSIIKSRGSKHSNQLRELIFSDKGITLADPYAAGGEVLMGALRIEKENAVHAETSRKRYEIDQKRREVEQTMTERDHHLVAAQRDLRNRTDELDTLRLAEERRGEESVQRQDEVVRDRDDKLLREQPARARPAIKKPASAGVKKRGNAK
ncbi:MAG: circadian clock protein KaiC [Chthoniobacter sp.]|nr:circadian clock protein KaiC [Chthoniobacter sp.]